jgi:geranylgeranyl pyrophosphate synthase
LFDPEHLERIVPRVRTAPSADASGKVDLLADPISATEAIAYDFLAKGGKHSRPFITLAVYDAMTGGKATLPGGEEVVAGWSDGVKRTAMSIETFHKASLVHDDIEDGDRFRYGEEAVHVRYGVPTAINVGDYLVGLGYRLVSRETRSLGAEVVADLLDLLAEAHQRLAEGQGAELVWRDGRDKQLKPIDALKIYALKTAPAFEAAFFCGLRLAGDITPYVEPVRTFARNLGVAFQILNDLKDWSGDVDNKLSSGGDIAGGRPTVLWALALEGLAGTERQELLDLVTQDVGSVATKLHRVRHLYRQADVFDKAERLVEKHRQRCQAIAEQIQPAELRRLFEYLIEVVLDRPTEEAPAPVVHTVTITPPQPISSK